MHNSREEVKGSISRREFLNVAWLASLGFLLVDMGGVFYLFSMPIFKQGQFGGVFALGRAGRRASVPGR